MYCRQTGLYASTAAQSQLHINVLPDEYVLGGAEDGGAVPGSADWNVLSCGKRDPQ